jgi:hypothetical protein
MAKVGFLEIPPDLEKAFSATYNRADRFEYSRIRLNKRVPTRKQKKGLTAKSLLPAISEIWAGFSDTLKNSWKSAGTIIGIDGWHMFVKDQTLRMKGELSGTATPSILHQSKIGLLRVESPATSIKLTQLHPHIYFVDVPVHGKKGMRELAVVREDFALPLSLEISYKSNLTATGANPFARFYAVIFSLYQGTEIETICSVEISLVSDWALASAEILKVVGAPKSYQLFLELHDVRGDLTVDNLSAHHSGQNWVRDPFCNDIDQAFTRAFYQVPKHWVAMEISEGCWFGSMYPDLID